jgi:hypothetical protein
MSFDVIRVQEQMIMPALSQRSAAGASLRHGE